MKKYKGTVKREGFTPTHCHYFIVEFTEDLDYKSTELLLQSKPTTQVYFKGNPMHDYIENRLKVSMPIIIQAEHVVITTNFSYTHNSTHN